MKNLRIFATYDMNTPNQIPKKMTKQTYFPLLISLLLLGSCQSVEQLSIDYMLPAEVNFPASLRRVAVVDNMPATPQNKLIAGEEKQKKNENELARLTGYHNGDAAVAAESLAEALTAENYFDEVVICDSALRSKDINPRESTLSQEEVNELTRGLNVDFLIAMENIQMGSIRKISFMPEWGVFVGTVDVKIYPTVKVYLPTRKGPMITITGSDSIFWEEAGSREADVRHRLLSEEDMLKQASNFAGKIPVKYLLPHWKTEKRYLFGGGSVSMRDAAVYVKEENWPEAINLWQQVYNARKGKQKMYAACNIALAHEMQDNIDTALEWAMKAQDIAREKDKSHTFYSFISTYVNELQKRKEGMVKLKMQMSRFNRKR